MKDIIKNIAIFYPIFLFLYFFLCYLFQYLTSKVPDKKIQKTPVKYNIKRDIKNSVISLFFAATFLSIGVYCEVSGLTYEYRFTDFPVLNFILEFFLGLFLFDTAFYWLHRLVHANKFLFKKAHLLHHKNNAPTVWGSYNETIEDTILLQSFFAYIVFIAPISAPALIFLNFYTLFLDVLGHSGYNVVERIPFTFFTVVEDHDSHHKHYNCNYAPYFTVWDKIMKTYKE